MANLSDLANMLAEPAIPAWISALGESRGFVEYETTFRPASETMSSPSEPNEVDARITAAFTEGEAAGRAFAETEINRHKAAFKQLKLAMQRMDEATKIALRDRLIETVAGLCSELVEPELLTTEALGQRCMAAADLIGDSPARCTLHLHPEDMALLSAQTTANWRLIGDTALGRGALLLEGPDGAVSDDPAHWRRSFAEALSA